MTVTIYEFCALNMCAKKMVARKSIFFAAFLSFCYCALVDPSNASQECVFRAGFEPAPQSGENFESVIFSSMPEFEDPPGAPTPFADIADINGDGYQDLVYIAHSDSTDLQIMEGDGTGRFQPGLSLSLGGADDAVAIVDHNRDGAPDIFAAKDEIITLFENRDGLFTPSLVLNLEDVTGFRAEVKNLIAVDLEGDGYDDLVIDFNSGVDPFVYLENNARNLSSTTINESPNAGREFLLEDIDGDGDIDLVNLIWEPSRPKPVSTGIEVFINDGAQNFTSQQVLLQDIGDSIEGAGAVAASITDFNGDQNPDILFIPKDSSGLLARVFEGDGSGSFSLGPVLDLGASRITGLLPFGLSGIAANFDPDGDGDEEIFFVNSLAGETSRRIVLLENTGDFVIKPRSFGSGNVFGPASTGDVNCDGLEDVVAVESRDGVVSDPKISVSLGRRDRLLSAPVSLVGESSLRSITLEDAHLPSVALIDETVLIFSQIAPGEFEFKESIGVGNHPVDLEVRDFDADGMQDIATANRESADISIVKGLANGAFALAQNFAVTDTSAVKSIEVADLNTNGRPDLLTANSNTSFSIFADFIGTSFNSIQNVNTDRGVQSLAVIDVDADSLKDVIVVGSRREEIFSQLAGFQFGRLGDFLGPDFGIAVDLNADGLKDLVGVDGSFDKVVEIFLNNGNNSFEPVEIEFPGKRFFDIGYGDLDGDNFNEIIAVFEEENWDRIMVIDNSGGKAFRVDSVFNLGTQNSNVNDDFRASISVEDLDKDGQLDLIVNGLIHFGR